MAWEIEYPDEFGDWWGTLTETEAQEIVRLADCTICGEGEVLLPEICRLQRQVEIQPE